MLELAAMANTVSGAELAAMLVTPATPTPHTQSSRLASGPTQLRIALTFAAPAL